MAYAGTLASYRGLSAATCTGSGLPWAKNGERLPSMLFSARARCKTTSSSSLLDYQTSLYRTTGYAILYRRFACPATLHSFGPSYRSKRALESAQSLLFVLRRARGGAQWQPCRPRVQRARHGRGAVLVLARRDRRAEVDQLPVGDTVGSVAWAQRDVRTSAVRPAHARAQRRRHDVARLHVPVRPATLISEPRHRMTPL
jgi:hypothetical protein